MILPSEQDLNPYFPLTGYDEVVVDTVIIKNI
jgi:hypothetical protein